MPNKPNLSVNIAGIAMKNPVMPASGCFGFCKRWACSVKPRLRKLLRSALHDIMQIKFKSSLELRLNLGYNKATRKELISC